MGWLISVSTFPEHTSIPRVGIPEAISRVVSTLKQNKSLSISSLAEKTRIDRRTVSKVIDMLLDIQETLRSREIETERVGRRFMIRFKERTARARKILASAKAKVAKRRGKLTCQEESE